MTASPTTDLQQLASALLSSFGSLRRSIRRSAARPEELAGLTEAQRELARLVRRRPGISVAEAARELRLAPNTVSTLVRQLAQSALLERTPDDADRRVARLSLAPPFAKTVGAWHDRRAVVLAEAIAGLSASDRRRLQELEPVLARLANAVEAE
jgi:DNA-binding MarR family transcriptional regulator